MILDPSWRVVITITIALIGAISVSARQAKPFEADMDAARARISVGGVAFLIAMGLIFSAAGLYLFYGAYTDDPWMVLGGLLFFPLGSFFILYGFAMRSPHYAIIWTDHYVEGVSNTIWPKIRFRMLLPKLIFARVRIDWADIQSLSIENQKVILIKDEAGQVIHLSPMYEGLNLFLKIVRARRPDLYERHDLVYY